MTEFYEGARKWLAERRAKREAEEAGVMVEVDANPELHRPKMMSRRYWQVREIKPPVQADAQKLFFSNPDKSIPDADADIWLLNQDRIFKTNAGYVFAEYLEVAADATLEQYEHKFGRLPRGVLPFKGKPGPGFTLTLKSTAITPEDIKVEQQRQQRMADGSLLNVSRMSDFEKKQIEWLWPNRIPAGAMSTLAGEPDVGKSLLTLYITACITRGLPFYGSDVPTPVGEVLILAAEDDPENTLLPRLEAAGADPDGVHLLRSVMTIDEKGATIGERAAQLDKDVKAICAALDKNPYIRLVIIDPISSYLGNANMNRDQEVREVLMPLVNKAQASGIVVLLVAHFNKNSETRVALDKVGGTKALVAIGRSAWTCVREPKDDTPVPEGQIEQGERYMFLKLKGNLAPSKIGGLYYTIRTREIQVSDKSGNTVMADTPYIQFLEETKSTAQDVVIDNKKTPGRPKTVTGCEVWLNDYLASKGGYAPKEAILGHGNDAGFKDRTIERAKAALKLESEYVDGVMNWGRNIPKSDDTPQHTRNSAEHGGSRPGAGRKKRNTVDLEEVKK